MTTNSILRLPWFGPDVGFRDPVESKYRNDQAVDCNALGESDEHEHAAETKSGFSATAPTAALPTRATA